MAGLTTDGSWVLIRHSRSLPEFRQQSIVVCKLDKGKSVSLYRNSDSLLRLKCFILFYCKESKEEYNRSVNNLRTYKSLTYEVLTKQLSWYAALEECSQRGGHLASVHDKDQDDHLKLIAKTDGFPLWIGLSDQDVGVSCQIKTNNPNFSFQTLTAFLFSQISGSAYEWSDGTKLKYQSNIVESLSGSSSDPHEAKCLFINPAGDWVRTSCTTEQEGAICYITETTTSSQSETSNRRVLFCGAKLGP